MGMSHRCRFSFPSWCKYPCLQYIFTLYIVVKPPTTLGTRSAVTPELPKFPPCQVSQLGGYVNSDKLRAASVQPVGARRRYPSPSPRWGAARRHGGREKGIDWREAESTLGRGGEEHTKRGRQKIVVGWQWEKERRLRERSKNKKYWNNQSLNYTHVSHVIF